MADRLIALADIQDNFIRYHAGDELPADAAAAASWVEAGTAMWVAADAKPPTWVKARQVTALPGLPGTAVGGEQTGDDLVGRVPITPERMRFG